MEIILGPRDAIPPGSQRQLGESRDLGKEPLSAKHPLTASRSRSVRVAVADFFQPSFGNASISASSSWVNLLNGLTHQSMVSSTTDMVMGPLDRTQRTRSETAHTPRNGEFS